MGSATYLVGTQKKNNIPLLNSNIEALAHGETTKKCYQTMGYKCTGTHSSISYKCTNSSTAEECRTYEEGYNCCE